MKDDRNDDYCKLYQPEEGVLTKRIWRHGRDFATEFIAQPGVKYLIIPCTIDPGFISKFTLTVYTVEKCSITPAIPPPTVAVRGAWSKKNGTAGGCRNYATTWTQNPQYILRITQPCRPVLLLEQTGLGTFQSAVAVGIYVMYGEPGSTKKVLDWQLDVPNHQADFAYTANLGYEIDFEPGQYNILPCTFDAGVERQFTLKVAGVEGVQLIQADN